MEITKNVLELLQDTIPGNYGIYQIAGCRMMQLKRAAGLPKLSDMTPLEYDELIREDAAEIVLVNDRDKVKTVLKDVLDSGREADITFRIRHRTRFFIWIHAFAKLIGTKDGMPVIFVNYHSTSDESDDHARLLESTATAVYVIDLENHEILFANDSALKLWKIEECGDEPCYRIIHGRKETCPWCVALKLKDGIYRQKDFYDQGLDCWLDIRCRAMDWHGRAAAAVYAYDVTEEVRLRQNLELQKKDMEFVVDNIPAGIGVCTVIDGKVTPVAINQKMIGLLGTTVELFTKNDHNMLFNVHHDDAGQVRKVMMGCAAAGHDERMDYRYRLSGEQEWRWYRLVTRSIAYGRGTMVFTCLIDVTAEKGAAMEALKSRSMYRTAVAASRIIVWEYDPYSRRITMQMNNDYTQEICEKYGIPEIVENGPQELSKSVMEKQREVFLDMYHRIDAGESYATCEVGMKLGNRIFYWKIICTAVYDDSISNRLLAVYCTGQDVTARYEAQERFRNAFEHTLATTPNTIGSFRHNITANLTDSGRGSFSREFAEAAQGTVDRHVEALLSTIEREEDRIAFRKLFSREQLLKAFDEGRTHLEYEYPILLKEQRRWVRCAVNMLRNPSTGDVEAVSLATDITDIKKRETIERLITKDVFDYVGVLYLKTGMFEIFNKRPELKYPAIRQLVPYAECVEYVGSNFIAMEERAQFLASSDPDNIRRSLEANGSYESSYLRTEAGVTSRHELRCCWLDKNGGEVLMMRTDVTAAYEQEQRQLYEMQQALYQIEKANAAKSEFLSRMSHDMRTPLNGIIGMTYLTEKMEVSSQVRDNLAKIHNSSKFLLGLINDILDMTKAESGKIELSLEPYSIGQFEEYIDAVIRPLCKERNQKLITEYYMPEGFIPLVDKLRMNQIVFNLLSNAVKYSPEGSIIEYRDISSVMADGRIRDEIVVADHGIGMSKGFQKVLFEPFMQENRIDNSEMHGSGLGLSITKKLVDAMGGTIAVKSRLGEGTTIFVTLVFERSTEAYGLPADEKARETKNGNLNGLHILLCEDHPLNQEIAMTMLTDKGAIVTVADDGEAGLKRFEASDIGYYDCVLMDIRMPVLNGYEATRAIRSLDRSDAKEVPIVAMTADAFADDVMKCTEAGMNGHISKPVDPDIMFDTIVGLVTH